ncbi:unnamed protein product [Closterium sp. NIES-53]
MFVPFSSSPFSPLSPHPLLFPPFPSHLSRQPEKQLGEARFIDLHRGWSGPRRSHTSLPFLSAPSHPPTHLSWQLKKQLGEKRIFGFHGAAVRATHRGHVCAFPSLTLLSSPLPFLLPTPFSRQLEKQLGEKRIIGFHGVALSVGEEVDFGAVTAGIEDRREEVDFGAVTAGMEDRREVSVVCF